jgi:hypothetical protein
MVAFKGKHEKILGRCKELMLPTLLNCLNLNGEEWLADTS